MIIDTSMLYKLTTTAWLKKRQQEWLDWDMSQFLGLKKSKNKKKK